MRPMKPSGEKVGHRLSDAQMPAGTAGARVPPALGFAGLAAPPVCGLSPYEPGKPIAELERELGVTGSIKLASNENPLGAGRCAQEAARLALEDLGSYPDGGGFQLKRALARHHGVSEDCITLGNGSNDVLDLVARAFLGPGVGAVFSEHAFAVYGLVTQSVGAEARIAPALPKAADQPFGHDLNAMAVRVDARVRVVFVANPNNPTGTWVRAGELESFLGGLPETALCVVDEAYFEYVDEPDYPDASTWLDRFPNLVVTRTFSKVHGLAALRVGYSVSHPEVAELLNRVRHPFNVNHVAQAAAIAALGDPAHVAASVAVNRSGLRQLSDGLYTIGLDYIPTVGNFLCVDTGCDAGAVYQRLLRRGVIVRPVAGYGLPHHLRITVGTREQNERVLEAIARGLRP